MTATYRKLSNRGNLYLVQRYHGYEFQTTCGAFSDLEAADEAAGMFRQQWIDKVGDDKGVRFIVDMTTFYG